MVAKGDIEELAGTGGASSPINHISRIDGTRRIEHRVEIECEGLEGTVLVGHLNRYCAVLAGAVGHSVAHIQNQIPDNKSERHIGSISAAAEIVNGHDVAVHNIGAGHIWIGPDHEVVVVFRAVWPGALQPSGVKLSVIAPHVADTILVQSKIPAEEPSVVVVPTVLHFQFPSAVKLTTDQVLEITIGLVDLLFSSKVR